MRLRRVRGCAAHAPIISGDRNSVKLFFESRLFYEVVLRTVPKRQPFRSATVRNARRIARHDLTFPTPDIPFDVSLLLRGVVVGHFLAVVCNGSVVQPVEFVFRPHARRSVHIRRERVAAVPPAKPRSGAVAGRFAEIGIFLRRAGKRINTALPNGVLRSCAFVRGNLHEVETEFLVYSKLQPRRRLIDTRNDRAAHGNVHVVAPDRASRAVIFDRLHAFARKSPDGVCNRFVGRKRAGFDLHIRHVASVPELTCADACGRACQVLEQFSGLFQPLGETCFPYLRRRDRLQIVTEVGEKSV